MSLFDSASIVITPNGVKEGKLYSIKPTDGSGDLSVTRATTATRVNSSGLISSVATNVPRLDYTNGTCPSILVEPQRTNLALRSEEFDNASWVKTNSTITANSITAPDGTLSADTLSLFAANSNITQNINSAIGSNTFSVYAKTLSGTKKFRFFRFNATDGLVSSVDFTATTEWQRFTFVTSPSVSISNWYIANTTIGDSGNIYLWGAQLETGSNATSYIPTTSASVTRNADVISKTGISSLIGQTEGTVFIDFDWLGNLSLPSRLFQINNGTSSSDIFFNINATTGNIQLFVNNVAKTLGSIISISVIKKLAFVYTPTSLKVFINGTLDINLTETVTFTLLDRLNIGSSNLAADRVANLDLKEFVIHKTALTDEQCINLTTL